MLDMLEDLREVDRLARKCVLGMLKIRRCWDVRDMMQEARSAMLECLASAYAGGTEASTEDLLNAGRRELAGRIREYNKTLGDRAAVYWMDIVGDDQVAQVTGRVKSSVAHEARFAEEITDRIALSEVFEGLSASSQETLLAFAVHDCRPTRTAEHLLVSRQTVCRRLSSARHEFYDSWYDWESVPKVPPLTHRREATDLPTHCSQGHEFTPENTSHKFEKARGRSYRYCLTCNRENVARQKAARRKLGDTS